MSLDNYITVNISQSAPSVSLPGFGVMLIASAGFSWLTGTAGDLIRYYSSLTAVAVDFATSAPEYLAAQAAFSANPKPSKIAIGKIPTLVAGVTNFAFSTALITGNQVTLTVNGVALAPITYATSAAATMTALAAAVAALGTAGGIASCTVDGSVPTQLDVTGVAGATLSISATITGGASQPTTTTTVATPAVTYSSGLTAIRLTDSGWYGLVTTSRTDACILDTAAWAEANLVKYVACTGAAAALTTATTDVVSLLKGKSYANTVLMYHAVSTEYPDATWLAEMLSYTPGSVNWMYKTLPSITPDPLTDTQRINLLGKNGNCYTTQAGINMTEPGKVASGGWADAQVGLDWFKANLQADIFSVFNSLPKVPFTDGGIAIIENAERARVKLAVDAGIIDGSRPITYNTPTVASQSSANRQARTLTGMGFTCYLAGAIDTVTFALNFLT